MTFEELQDAVLFNSFGERYRTMVKGYLNDAVGEVCRRLELLHAEGVVAHDSDGLADIASIRLLRIDTVYVADGPASTSVQAVRRQARYEVAPLNLGESAASVSGRDHSRQPYVYRAVMAPDAIGVYSRLEVLPVQGEGFLAVSGLSRPARMVDDADESGLSPEVDNVLVAFARMRAFQAEDDMQMGVAWQQEYDRALRALRVHQPSTYPIITPGSDLYL